MKEEFQGESGPGRFLVPGCIQLGRSAGPRVWGNPGPSRVAPISGECTHKQGAWQDRKRL